MSKTCAIIPAAGRGLRMGGGKPKQLVELSGKPVLLHTLETLSGARFLSGILVVAQNDFLRATENLIRAHCSAHPEELCYLSERLFPDHWQPVPDKGGIDGSSTDHQGAGCRTCITVIVGGTERQDSVFNALQKLPEDCEWVLIHDGVRPFVSGELIENTWKAGRETGAAIAALSATDTIKRVREKRVVETLLREEIWFVQTPQVFRKDIIMTAYLEARRQGWSGTDDAFFVERLGLPVAVVPGERSNIKVTTPEDLAWGSWFLTHARGGQENPTADSGKNRCE
jgi:2-C-methyl-D-erythritol 4-phosphate cytidylyltransferase